LAPFRASSSAMARPIPPDAPVMAATCPDKDGSSELDGGDLSTSSRPRLHIDWLVWSVLVQSPSTRKELPPDHPTSAQAPTHHSLTHHSLTLVAGHCPTPVL
jgi:hypothetical protein